MSTTPPVVPSSSKVQTIEAIILAALQGLQLVPGIGASAAIIGIFASILTNAQAAYQAEVGMPVDLSKIPLETPAP